jgi:hypothetical protein
VKLLTYKELEKFICECCKNSVPISFKSFYQEIRENKEDIKWEICDDISNRWRKSNYKFSKGKKTYRFNDVYRAVIYKKDTNDSKNTLVFYYVSTDINKNNEIHILGVCKYPWSYELKALNKEQYKAYSTTID